MSAPLLTVEGLAVDLPAGRVLHDVSLTVAGGEAVGLVGESGSGKSMTARTVARLLPDGARVTGSVRVCGEDVLALRGAGLRRHRTRIATVFQDPRAHVNPVRTVGDFMTEALRTLGRVPAPEARRRAVEALGGVGVPDPERRLRQYPHELSGGLLQRVMIAAMLLGEPELLLADEPTTALDVTTQAEVVAILDELRRERGMAVLFITHDLDLAAAVCDRTAVMYAGRIVEAQASRLLHDDPLHPYTAALAAARPSIDAAAGRRLPAIAGRPVSAFEAPGGCAFASRCPAVQDACRAEQPPLTSLGGGLVRCRRAGELWRGRTAEAVPRG